jgi:probable F420-dependent oxidoreductase
VEIGVYAVCTDLTLRPGEVARLVEDAGFDAIQFGEHSHIPVSRSSPYPGGDLPADYLRTYDLFIAMTAAALATTRLRVSSGILQLAQRDPITTAKEAASIDVLSDGRMDLIVGVGWNEEEMRNHGVAPEDKYDVVRERMLAIKEIWHEEEASFHGRHVDFDPLWSWPKPVQPGGVPLILGGNSPGSEERAREYGDGWGPIGLPGVLERVRAYVAEGDGGLVHIAGVAAEPAAVEAWRGAGADRIVLGLGPPHPGQTERRLEELRSVVDTAVGSA